ncbi:MAG: CotH kinase family protein [Candidatus Azobacteroides sp.]|nr:CotH kinase family protein [Candidatus Azobacteroides sp.]
MEVDPEMCGIDHEHKLILINQDLQEINNLFQHNPQGIAFKNTTYYFLKPIQALEIGIPYLMEAQDKKKYTLYFTSLPVIHITTENEIADEPRVLADFRLTESNKNSVISKIGIEYRGKWSQSLAKKPFRIEFWEDNNGLITKNVSLLGMRSDDDWNLQAMYNEPLRLRSKTNNEIWLKIYSLYYSYLEPAAINGVRMEYAELFLNNQYRGIYCVSERVDRKQLKLKKYKSEKVKGELYKGVLWGASTYDYCINYVNGNETWSGFKYKYPSEIAPFWNNIHSFVYFVVNSSDEDFYSQYSSRFNTENSVDYFIFLNLLRALDNTGRNLYVAKYDTDQPYFYVPWDLDGTFGIYFDGTKLNITDDLLLNGFYKRLWEDTTENGWRMKLEKRWENLRNEIITHENITKMFKTNYEYLQQNGAYEREELIWPYKAKPEEEFEYLSQWVTKRLEYLDIAFNKPLSIPYMYEDSENNKVNIHLFNIKGILIKTILNTKIKNLPLDDLEKGIYILHIQDDKKTEVKKIGIQ